MNKKKITEILTSALQHHKKNNLDIAKRLYEKVLKIDPNHFETIFLLGSLLSQSKNFVKGQELLYHASQMNPNSSKVQNNLGMVLKELKRFEESINCFEKAIKIDPANIQAHNNLGATCEAYAQVLFKKNLHKQAVNFIQKGCGLIRFTQEGFKII